MITKSVVYPKVRDMETFERMVEQKDRQIKDIILDKDLAIAKRDSVIEDMDATINRLSSEINSLKK